ncbi:erythrocyte membrane protein 1, PfEMP1, putative [Plasmodium sp. DRC-Itaito]|nr:erythrocyte membrane protein 1, PfEMP1, putative [Plasmodium sp. DRC-Itaito]
MIEKKKEEKYIEQKKGTNRKPKPPVKLFSVLDIPKGEFDIPTKFSSNRYIPYSSAKHRGKRYIYIEGDTDDEKYIGDITSSDITSSSESEYEEIDLHVPTGPPKYKTLIEVVLEPSTSGKNAPNSGKNIPSDIQNDVPPMSDEEWNTLKHEFISQYLENEQKYTPNNNISGNSPTNTKPNHVDDNSDNITPRPTLYDNVDQKPFIMSIHDRNLYTGEEYSYDMLNSGIYPSSSSPNTISGNNDSLSGTNDSYSGNNDPISGNLGSYSDNPSSYSGNVGPYSGIDLINDALSRQSVDIYDEILKRKENELFGTENPKHTTPNSFAKHTNTDPIYNQINLFHKWLDRHRDMCEQWENNHERLDKLKKEWEKDTNSGDNIPIDNIPGGNKPIGNLSDTSTSNLSDTVSGKLSDIPNHNNKHSDIPYVLNTDVSIQIDMDNPNQVENPNPNLVENPNPNLVENLNPNLVENMNPVDQNPLLVENNINPVDSNNPLDTPTKVQIELSMKNTEMMEDNFPIGDVWDI